MISLLRRNRKKNASAQRPLTRSVLSDQHQQQLKREDRAAEQQPNNQVELYNDCSLDSLMFAASLGLVSTHQSASVKDLMLVVRDQLEPKEQQSRLANNASPKDLMLVVQDQAQGRKQARPPQQMEFHCRFCGKGYRWKSTMKRHETLECGDKPPSFQCPYCDYRARQRGNLTVHLKRHHLKA